MNLPMSLAQLTLTHKIRIAQKCIEDDFRADDATDDEPSMDIRLRESCHDYLGKTL